MVLGLAAVVLSVTSLTVDVSSLFLHRQMAQTAADAACQAGAADVLGSAAGLPLPNMGFTPGISGDCSTSSTSAICQYAALNGYTGAGGTAAIQSGAPGNDVAFSFPSTVTGVNAPANSVVAHPFLNVTVTENVPTTFLQMFTGKSVQQIAATSTCGLASVAGAPPMVVLHPSMAGALTYSSGGTLTIVGGAGRALQVNSSSANALSYTPAGLINVSQAGPSSTGLDVGVVGGPGTAPSSSGQSGLSLGTSGSYRAGAIPMIDPFAAVGSPAGMGSVSPPSSVNGTWVSYHQDGCPDNTGNSGNPSEACVEYAPGYYPNGITMPNSYVTAIFLPGVYYLNGSLTATGSNVLRNATPCNPTCGPLSTGAGSQTDGVTFYFSSGSMNIAGCSGCAAAGIDTVASSALTCDGTTPNAQLHLPATFTGNVLLAPCTKHGGYVDATGDTNDTAGSATTPGIRGLLVYQGHGDTSAPTLGSTGQQVFVGSLYFHSTGYADVVTIQNSPSSSSYVVGNLVADQVNLPASSSLTLALQSQVGVPLVKIGMFQ
jgi:hypothetical protein